MREIKFRGLRTDGKRWITGSLVKYWTSESDSYLGIMGWKGDHFEVLIESVGQFTGLTDSTGRDIYEGDIVKCLLATEPEDKGFICQFKDYRWKFKNVRYPDDDFEGTVNYNYIQQNCEVIGNIYENPDLLK
jgi:uncharacterized phage protein (TIGR01671 family)